VEHQESNFGMAFPIDKVKKNHPDAQEYAPQLLGLFWQYRKDKWQTDACNNRGTKWKRPPVSNDSTIGKETKN